MKLAITVFAAALAFSAPAFARGGMGGMGGNSSHMGNSGNHVSYDIVTIKGTTNGTNPNPGNDGKNTGNNGKNTGHNGMNTNTSTMHGSTLGLIHHVHLERVLRRDREEIARLKFLIFALRHKIELKTATPVEVKELRKLTRVLERIDLQTVQIANQLGTSY